MDESKILQAISEELKAIKNELDRIKAMIIKAKDDGAEKPHQTNYVAATEQRFIGLSQKIDRLIAMNKDQNFAWTIVTICSIILGVAVLSKEVVHQIMKYVATH